MCILLVRRPTMLLPCRRPIHGYTLRRWGNGILLRELRRFRFVGRDWGYIARSRVNSVYAKFKSSLASQRLQTERTNRGVVDHLACLRFAYVVSQRPAAAAAVARYSRVTQDSTDRTGVIASSSTRRRNPSISRPQGFRIAKVCIRHRLCVRQ